MDRDKIIELLENVKQGTVETNEAMEQLRKLPFQDLGFAKIDHHRALRTGYPEVVFCQSKTDEQVEKFINH